MPCGSQRGGAGRHFSTLAAILHLGNVSLEEQDAEGSAGAGGSGGDAEACFVTPGSAQHHLACAAELLGLQADALVAALTTRRRMTKDGEQRCLDSMGRL